MRTYLCLVELQRRGPHIVIRALSPYLRNDAIINSVEGIPSSLESVHDENIAANSYFFSQLVWMQEWLRSVHRYPRFRERWHAVGATLDGKVAIDVGCGPGNVLKSLGDKPAVVIGRASCRERVFSSV